MIISASRRTDIPAFYMPWFVQQLKEGQVEVPNPMNPRQIRKVSLSSDAIDGIVFWTKNPGGLLPYLDALKPYNIYVQVTLNDYPRRIESQIPSLQDRIRDIKRLSRAVGRDHVHWRYDPILMMDQLQVHDHLERFGSLLQEVNPYVDGCTISFYDLYAKTKKRGEELGFYPPSELEMKELGQLFGFMAMEVGLPMMTCCEGLDLSSYGIRHGACIDGHYLSQVWQTNLSTKKAISQRENCGCTESVDIGIYDTCVGGCQYCYATRGSRRGTRLTKDHPYSVGGLAAEEKVAYNVY